MANQKKISELPIINALSGSAASVIPVVVGGTTNQIPAERFSEFVNAYNATTGSNTFIGNQTITGNLDISGNAIIGGNVEIAGMITAQQYNVTYVSSSIQYQSGSTEFGDTADDTHIFTGTIVLNGNAIGLGELNAQTSSQDSLNTSLGLITSSIYDEITSIDNVLSGVSSVTGAFAVELGSIDSHILGVSEQTSSQNSINSGISAVTGAFAVELGSVDSHILGISQQTASQDLVNLGISSVTGSLIGITNGLMAFTAALDDNYATDAQLYQLYQATRSLEIQTGSQNSINSGISAVTGAFATELGDIQDNITSFNNVFGGVSAVTGAFSTELGQLQTQNTSQGGVNNGISAVTGAFATELGSIDSHILNQATQTGSQDLVNLGISSVTGSLIGIANGLMAFTAALDSTYATDVEVADAVSALNTQTGSQNSINSGISAVTGAFATELSGIQNNITSFDNVFGGVSAVTGAFATELSGIQTTLGGHRNELDGLESYTASLKAVNLVSGSSQLPQIAELFTQNTSQLGVNLGISTFTGSLRDEVNGIESYTASLKGAIEVSGQDVNVLGMITAQQFNVTLVSSSVMYQSGSTKFGDTNDDKHQFTGSLDILGSAGSGISLRHSNGTNIGEFVELSGVQGGGLTLKNSVGTQHILLNAGGDSYISSSLAVGTVTPSNYAKLRVYNDISDATYGTKIQAIFGNSDYLDSDANVLTGTGTSETQFLNGSAGRPATISLGGSLSAGEGLGLINFFRSGNTNGYRSRAYIASGVSNTGTADQHGAYVAIATTNDGDTTPITRVTVESGGDMTIENGNLVIGTSGKGIDFSATSDGSGTTSSELLDDYEEGTWTGTLKGSVSDPSTPVTATGYYTKVGNKVFATIAINNATTTGASGIVTVSGLPFTSASTNNSQGSVMCTFYDFNGGTSLVALLGASSSEVSFLSILDDGDWNDILHVAGSGRSLRFSITYFV